MLKTENKSQTIFKHFTFNLRLSFIVTIIELEHKSFLYYQKIFLFFKLWWRNKVFRLSLEAINYAFPRTNYNTQKIIFQNTQKMIKQQDVSLQSW